MFTVYDLEVYKHDWLAVFNTDGKITKLHNDRDGLKAFLSSVNYLVGYNNYNYDDRIIAAILKDMDPFQVSQKIINNKPFKLRLQNPLTLDVMQELKGVSLKEAQANLKLNIIETPVDFNIDRLMTKSEINKIFTYCKNDVETTKLLFDQRESYFASKFEIIKEFNLPATNIKKTRANLVSEVLNAKPSTDKNRLNLIYDDRLPLHELPEPIVKFYKQITKRYEEGVNYQELESEKFTYRLAGIDHVFGFGGLHAAKENYKGEGDYMHIDIGSYYPSLIINNHFIQKVDEFKKIYDTRVKLKADKDSKADIYKILLNSTYGAMKSKWNKLYNPQMANNIVVNGQLIITHLICLLENHCELIQTNTDGIIIKYEKGFERNIIKVLHLFEEAYQLTFDTNLITKIAQRDVNNYVLQYKSGEMKAIGRFANYDGGNFERNSLTVIDKALVDYFMKGIRVNKTVIDLWKNQELHWFQYVVKAGKFDGMAQEVITETLFEDVKGSEFKPIQNVNRVFAAKDKQLGSVFKTKNDKETKYSKVPYTSDHCLVWNDELSKLDKRQINLNWYIKQIESYLF
ncbi:DNA polymerase B [Virgibacillus halodenitrificans]|uniref:DNA polymerase domain-containing protein n=1 Tax=Virgibacillus halodenitrificans TaxID=1482 RepID=UPI001F3CC2F0|nr:DNA polymerase domain-containing protein [Virgibacillus halodenitrificans]MCG1029290.1 DNA polymerase B [Virgibacillus halodenitrificans]